MRENFNFFNGVPVRVMVKLFESMVQSILLNGWELWGIHG